MADDEAADRFIRGLQPHLQHEVLKEDPPNFNEAVRLAERLSRLHDFLQSRDRPPNPKPPQQKPKQVQNPWGLEDMDIDTFNAFLAF